MSLAVDVFVIGDDGEMFVMDVPDGCSDLAGFESWRTSVWGSETVRALGARFFPTLARGDLTVVPDQVSDFLRECALIRANIEAVAPRTDPATPGGWHARQISERLANVENAAERALRSGGGVIIW